MRTTTVRYNAVIDTDLYYVIYEYIRHNHKDCIEKFKVRTGWDLDNLSFEEWKEIAKDAVQWLESKQLPDVTYITYDEGSYDEWAVLYYQVLAYMDEECRGELSYRARTLEEQFNLCVECIEALKYRIFEMHEPTDEDVDNMI